MYEWIEKKEEHIYHLKPLWSEQKKQKKKTWANISLSMLKIVKIISRHP